MSERNDNNVLLQLYVARQNIVRLENKLKESDSLLLEKEKLKNKLNEKMKQINEKSLELDAKIVENAILNNWIEKQEFTKNNRKCAFISRRYTKSEIAAFKEENDALKEHLKSLEIVLNDINKKYERSKAIIRSYDDYEGRWIYTNQQLADYLKEDRDRFEHLKSYSKSRIELLNQQYFQIKAAYEPKIEQLEGIVKRWKIKYEAMIDNYYQKKYECTQLAALCEESLGKWKKN